MFRLLREDALTRAYLTGEGGIRVEHCGLVIEFASPAELNLLVRLVKSDRNHHQGVHLRGWGEPLYLAPEQLPGFLQACQESVEEAQWWQGALRFHERDALAPSPDFPNSNSPTPNSPNPNSPNPNSP